MNGSTSIFARLTFSALLIASLFAGTHTTVAADVTVDANHTTTRTVLRPNRNAPVTNDRKEQPNLPTLPPTENRLPNSIDGPDDAAAIQMEITGRYQDPRMVGFLKTASMSRIVSMYVEASRLVDERHVDPKPYAVRVNRALRNVSEAVANPAFAEAAGGRASSEKIDAFQAELERLMDGHRPQSMQDAVGIMQWTANLAAQRLGHSREAVALEFFHGSIDALDKHSAFVPAKLAGGPSAELEMQSAGLEEQIVGIGVELKTHEDGAIIVDVIDGGPAAEGRLQRGDIIIGVGGESMAGKSLGQVAEKIGGRSGTPVLLKIRRDDREGHVSLVRRSVYVGSVTGTRIINDDEKVGYIRLKQFSESSSQDLDKALWTLHRQGMQSLILDLRGNPGGLLTAAIEISDKFLPNGAIVETRGRNSADNTREVARFDRTWAVPLVVLVDDGSASASEIFAAAIQENGRGLVIGRQSYGKGTVQTHFPMRSAGGDLKLTTARFYSPNGRAMAGTGVTPDVVVQQAFKGLPVSMDQDPDIATALRITGEGRAKELTDKLSRRSPSRTRNYGQAG